MCIFQIVVVQNEIVTVRDNDINTFCAQVPNSNVNMLCALEFHVHKTKIEKQHDTLVEKKNCSLP